MKYNRLTDRAKALLWFFITPVQPFVRDLLLKIKVLKHNGRQPHIIGKLVQGRTVEEFSNFLNSLGFETKFVAWKDEGEILSMRLRENFEWQYHIRLFKDMEIRGHHEYTPESHPILHLKEQNLTAKTNSFKTMLNSWVE